MRTHTQPVLDQTVREATSRNRQPVGLPNLDDFRSREAEHHNRANGRQGWPEPLQRDDPREPAPLRTQVRAHRSHEILQLDPPPSEARSQPRKFSQRKASLRILQRLQVVNAKNIQRR